uniref:Uncharacterized protein n=1 Tax=Arion vulgaris TaxID=1028688 RepID=A0A0B6YCK4_9EUPU
MTDSIFRKCLQMFNEGCQNMHDVAQSGQPVLMNNVNKFVRTDAQHLFLPYSFLKCQRLFS